MKHELFNRYATEVCRVFDIEKEGLFKKDKSADLVDARYLLYYLCSDQKIRLTGIQKYMKKNGYDIPHSTIHYGINQVKKKIHLDPDYRDVINKINYLCTA